MYYDCWRARAAERGNRPRARSQLARPACSAEPELSSKVRVGGVLLAQIPKSLQSFTYSGVHWSGYIYPASQCENMRLYRRLLAPRCTTMYHAVHRITVTPCVDHTTVRTGTGFESHSGTVLYIPVVLHHPRQSEAIRDHISDCLSSETVLKISTTRGVNSILPEVRRWCSGRGRIIMCR